MEYKNIYISPQWAYFWRGGLPKAELEKYLLKC